MSFKRNLMSFALLASLIACSPSPSTIADLCPGPIAVPDGAREVTGILCDHEWEKGTNEQEFCDWIDALDLQQEELKLYHEYRMKLP